MTLEKARERLYTIAEASPFGDVKIACYFGILALEYAEERGFRESMLYGDKNTRKNIKKGDT